MPYSIEDSNARVLAEIEGWPDGLLADYAASSRCSWSSGPTCGACRGERVVVLHAFVKKTRGTPVRHLRPARRRMREVRDG